MSRMPRVMESVGSLQEDWQRRLEGDGDDDQVA